MRVLVMRLLDLKIPFKYDGSNVILGEYDTGYYWVIETAVEYDEESKVYSVEYGTKGYPDSKCFKSVEDVIDFCKEIHRQKWRDKNEFNS